MRQTVRDLEEEHVKDIANSVKEHGLHSAAGTPSVGLAEQLREAELRSMLSAPTHGFVPFLDRDVKVFDSQHRTCAYNTAVTEMPDMAKDLEWIRVELWGRKDGEAMRTLEMLALGCELNRSTSRVRASTFPDMIHATMSSAQTLTDARGSLSVRSLAGAMWKLMSVNAGKRQVTRYAAIALAFLRNDFSSNNLKVFIAECPTLGVSHLGNSQLLTLDRIGMILGIECVAAHLKKPSQQIDKAKRKKKGAFHEIESHFYECFSQLYGCAREKAIEKAMEVKTLLDKQLELSKGQNRTTRQTICMQMSSYKGQERRNYRDRDQEAGTNLLLRDFKNTLNGRPPAPEPEVQAPSKAAEPRRSTRERKDAVKERVEEKSEAAPARRVPGRKRKRTYSREDYSPPSSGRKKSETTPGKLSLSPIWGC